MFNPGLLARLAGDRSGAAAVEFVLLAPVLALLAAGAMDATVLVVRTMEVRAAAQAGADFARVHGWDASGIEVAVRTSSDSPLIIDPSPAPTLSTGCASGGGVAPATGPLCPDGGTPGQYVDVNAQASYRPIIAWPGFGTARDLVAHARVRVK